jgi:COP9 signalosome complex subunit 1
MEEIYHPKGSSTNIKDQLDLERYLFNYQGNTRFNRLLHWLQLQSSTGNKDIYDLLVVELLRSSNTGLFRKLTEEKVIPPDNNNNLFDEWFSTTEKNLQTTLNILENDLLSAKSTTVKESIRLAYCELGILYYKWGRLDEAFKAFLRARDYCSLPKHHSDISYQLVLIAFDMKQYYNANNFVNKLLDLSVDTVTVNKGKMISALLSILNDNNYYSAVNKFLEMSEFPGEPSNLTSVAGAAAGMTNQNDLTMFLTKYDIGFYTFILCLATMNYSELKNRFSSNKSFINTFINAGGSSGGTSTNSGASGSGEAPMEVQGEAAPLESSSSSVPSIPAAYNPYAFLKLKQLLQDVMNNSFNEMFQLLPTLFSLLLNDLYLSRHAHTLMKMIIERLLLQFLQPYQVITLSKISEQFHLPLKQLVSLLISLISKGKLSAKIDSIKGLLIKNEINLEKKMIENTLELMEKNEYALKRGLLRVSLQKNHFILDFDQDQQLSHGGKMKRLQDFHEQQHSSRSGSGGRRNGPPPRKVGGNSRIQGRSSSSAHMMMSNAGTGSDDGDLSDHEDDEDDIMLKQAIAMSEASVRSIGGTAAGGAREEEYEYDSGNEDEM